MRCNVTLDKRGALQRYVANIYSLSLHFFDIR